MKRNQNTTEWSQMMRWQHKIAGGMLAVAVVLAGIAPAAGTALAQEVVSESAAATTGQASAPSAAQLPPVGTAENEAQIKKLEKFLTGSRWRGKFTTLAAGAPLGEATEEAYDIIKAQRLPEGDRWLLEARIKYGKRDVTVPIPLEIKWAGGTPVITVDRLLIPGLGTFDARVLIRNGKYSGTWSHDDVGGHLFGSIEKIDAPQQVEAE